MIKLFIKNSDDIDNPKVRRNYGYLGSIYGLITNIIMFTLKIVFANIYKISSMQADAINNASDIGMCALALISVYIVSRPASSKHPYGSARFEYIGSFVIAMAVIYLAVTQMVSAITEAIDVVPNEGVYTWNQIELWLPFGIMLFASLVKLSQVVLLISLGNKIGSMTLKATGKDARNDALVAFVIALSYLISPAAHYNIDPILTACVSFIVVLSGLSIIKEAVNALMGSTPDIEVIKKFKTTIMSYSVVLGIHDLEMHSYGQNDIRAYVHVEVDSSTPSMVLRDEIDMHSSSDSYSLFKSFFKHIDPIVIGDPETDRYKAYVIQACKEIDPLIYINDFRLIENLEDEESKKLVFDLVLPYDLLKEGKDTADKVIEIVKSFSSESLSFDIDIDDRSADLLTILKDSNEYN